jgi:hypothetical protein
METMEMMVEELEEQPGAIQVAFPFQSSVVLSLLCEFFVCTCLLINS